MNKIYFIITIFLYQFYFSQNTDIANVVTTPDGFYSKPGRVQNKNGTIDGSPYTNGKDFHIININHYSKDIQPLRYNAFYDEMEFKDNEELYYANKIENIIINFPTLNKIYKYLTYSYSNIVVSGYLVLLVENSKFSLYKREKKELMMGTKSTNAFTKDANDYYESVKDLFLLSKDNQFFKFPKSVSDAAELFSVNKNDLEKFIKTNKINISKEEGMIKLVEYINQH